MSEEIREDKPNYALIANYGDAWSLVYMGYYNDDFIELEREIIEGIRLGLGTIKDYMILSTIVLDVELDVFVHCFLLYKNCVKGLRNDEVWNKAYVLAKKI